MNQQDNFTLKHHSEETQEIMSQKNRNLVFCGNILLLILVLAFFAANTFVTFTDVHSFPMTMQNDSTSTIIVPAEDVTKIQCGQLMKIRMEVYPQEFYGDFVGHIMLVNLIPDEHGYRVTLKVDNVTNTGKSPELISGMRGTALFETSRRGFLRSVLMNQNN